MADLYDSRLDFVVNVDVNKTIIMSDVAQGKDKYEVTRQLIAETMWGAVDANGSWVYREGPSFVPSAGNDDLVSFSAFIDERGGGKEARRAAKRSFAKDYGYEHHVEVLAAELDGVHIVPSFFRMMIRLQDEGARFGVVFRTFGNDLKDISNEMNAFCEGRHRMSYRDTETNEKIPMDGTFYGVPDRRFVTPDDAGAFFRDSEATTLSLVSEEGLVEVYADWNDIYEAILAKLGGSRRTLGLKDYYPHWARQGEAADAGKLILVDRSADGVHQIMFDDNIERDHAHIVDVRDRATGEVVPYDEAIGTYMIRCDPTAAIRDVDYFYNAVKGAIARREAIIGGATPEDLATSIEY